jgi:hypothetical protein
MFTQVLFSILQTFFVNTDFRRFFAYRDITAYLFMVCLYWIVFLHLFSSRYKFVFVGKQACTHFLLCTLVYFSILLEHLSRTLAHFPVSTSKKCDGLAKLIPRSLGRAINI